MDEETTSLSLSLVFGLSHWRLRKRLIHVEFRTVSYKDTVLYNSITNTVEEGLGLVLLRYYSKTQPTVTR